MLFRVVKRQSGQSAPEGGYTLIRTLPRSGMNVYSKPIEKQMTMNDLSDAFGSMSVSEEGVETNVNPVSMTDNDLASLIGELSMGGKKKYNKSSKSKKSRKSRKSRKTKKSRKSKKRN